MRSYAALEQKLGYAFSNKKLLVQALTHRSMRGNHNERLEFLGDSILNCIIAYALYEKMPKAKEGDLSRYRSQLVCESTLASFGLEVDLGDYLILGEGELRAGGFRRQSIIADALEAIIAAIYLDADFVTCQRLVETWFATRIETVSTKKILRDPKSHLQEYLQSKKKALPHYVLTGTSGLDHDQVFHVRCEVPGIEGVAKGSGHNRKIAEQEAARAFLKNIFQVEI